MHREKDIKQGNYKTHVHVNTEQVKKLAIAKYCFKLLM